MPFKSLAQERYMFANHPKIAKDWAMMTDQSMLPEKVKKHHKNIIKHMVKQMVSSRKKKGNKYSGSLGK